MFKLIGIALGYYLLGIFGAFLGYMIGSSVDRTRAYGIGGINPLSAGQRQKVFLDTVFVLMGKLAKADGHISRDEIAHVEAFIKKVGMTVEHRQEAINQFKKVSTADFDMNNHKIINIVAAPFSAGIAAFSRVCILRHIFLDRDINFWKIPNQNMAMNGTYTTPFETRPASLES